MSESGGMKSLYIFVLVLNIVFPVMTYTFTTFGSSPEGYEIDLDNDALMMAGIHLVHGESHNLSYVGGWVIWTDINVTIRASFRANQKNPWFTNLGDGVQLQKQSAIDRALGPTSFINPYVVPLKSVITNKWHRCVKNITIVSDYDRDFNWSKFVTMDGHTIFLTPHESHGNMTKAVYEDAHLNCTIAKTYEEETNFNFWRFIGWYTSLMIGSESWGLPSIFSWVLRILGAVSLFAGIMLTKELIRI